MPYPSIRAGRVPVLILFFFLFLSAGKAQLDLGMHFMQGVWQSTLTNPALVPDQNVVLALPGFYNQVRIDNFSYNQVVRTDAQGQTIIDIDNVIEKMGAENILRNQTDLHTFGLSVKINKFYLQLGHNVHINTYLNYPKELAEVVWNGNAQYIGQEVGIGPDLLAQGYSSFYVGGAGEVAPGIRIGGRFKVLLGIADLSTQNRELNLFTSDDVYQATLRADYVLNSSGGLMYNGFGAGTRFDFNDGVFDLKDVFSSNYGIGVDLGAQARFGDWSFAISALDLGAITWRRDAANIELQGEYTYEGLDILKDALLDEVEVSSLGDSLEAAFDIEETSTLYSTNLPGRYYFSAGYQLTETWSLGALMYLDNFRDNLESTIGLSANARVSNFLNFGLMYSYTDYEPLRLGFNLALRGGPFQLLLATDNLITAFQFEDSNSANFRFGLNLVVGQFKKEKPDKNVVDPDEFFR